MFNLGIKKTRSGRRGFTIIELLVVIAIIGTLSSIVLSSLNSARLKARDAKRLSDLGQIQLALILHYDVCDTFPVCSTSATNCYNPVVASDSLNICTTSGFLGNWTQLKVAPVFIPSMPLDPINTGSGHSAYGYYYARGWKKIAEDKACSTGSATDYMIATRREGVSMVLYRCACDGTSCSSTIFNNSNLNYLLGN